MKKRYKKTTWIWMLAIIIFFSTKGFASTEEVKFQFYQESVHNVTFVQLLVIDKPWDFKNGFWSDTSFGCGNLLGENHEAYLFDSGFYKQINNRYSLGVEYKYLYDQKSLYNNIGGKLTKQLLSLTVKGVNKVGRFNVSGEFSYAPVGFYKYMNDKYRNLSGMYFGVGIATPVTESLSFSLETKFGKESYMDVSNTVVIAKVGLQYKFF